MFWKKWLPGCWKRCLLPMLLWRYPGYSQVLSSEESSSACLLRDCIDKTSHTLSECDSFRSLTIHQRWCFCSYFSICAVCLSASHGTDVHSCFYFYPFSEHLCLCSAFSDHCSLMCPSPSVKPPFSCSMNSPDCDCNFVQLSTWWTCSFKQLFGTDSDQNRIA